MQQPVSQIASAPDNADCKSDQNLNSLFVNEEICYRKENILYWGVNMFISTIKSGFLF